ncbi:hypothetical protein, partial [Streptococcus merionis]|uniref:hypothetical protein n=1 Tax=Streptococcus merionis TaxID=400065 RepID=UPI0026EC48B3
LGFTKTKEYKKILETYLEALNQLSKYQQWSTITDKVNEDMERRQGVLAKMYKEYKANRIAENEGKLTEIEKRFKNSRNVYDNPQAELLRRQDFDMELSLMDTYQVKEMLEDPNRDLSRYELKKIETLYRDNIGILTALQKRVPEEDDLYLNDPEYSRMNQENSVLKMIDYLGLAMFYVPDSESPDGYQYLNLTLVGQPYNIISGYKRIEEVNRLLGELDKAISSARSGLLSLTKREVQAPKYEFEEFDERIFRDSENFDITIRFKYLKERYDDKTTDRWDFRRDDYNPMAHLQFLERRLASKLKRDPEFAHRYRQAENVATYKPSESGVVDE